MRHLAGLPGAALGLALLLGACAGGGSRAPEPAGAPIALAPEHGIAAAAIPPPAAGDELAAPLEVVIDDGPPANGLTTPVAGDELPLPLDVISDHGPAANGPAAPAARRADLGSLVHAVAEERARAAVTPPRPAGREIGYMLVDLENGRVLAELNPDVPLIPASTVKLATAVVALDALGPDHRYRTELLARGPVRDGVLTGDLILKGGGDPALDVADLLGLAVRLRTAGIHAVEGRFLIDDTAFPLLTEVQATQPREAAYNASVGALSLAFNRVRVSWRGGGAVASLPPLMEARFEAAPPGRLPPGGVELKSAGDEALVWRIAAGPRREIWLPVKDPGLHAGHVFSWLAQAQGVELGTPQREAASSDAYLVAVHESPPLRRLVRDMLVYSNNVMAEMIGLSAAQRLGYDSIKGDEGALLLAYLRYLMPDVDWRGAALGNYSGLDSTARMTPRQLAALVRYGWHAEALPGLVPGGGWSGTLARRFETSGAAMRVWAKTGTVNYGSSLAGYLFPEVGRPGAFVTMVSDIGARNAYDANARPSGAAEAAARAWNARARAFQDDLVESWLEPLPAS